MTVRRSLAPVWICPRRAERSEDAGGGGGPLESLHSDDIDIDRDGIELLGAEPMRVVGVAGGTGVREDADGMAVAAGVGGADAGVDGAAKLVSAAAGAAEEEVRRLLREEICCPARTLRMTSFICGVTAIAKG